MEETALIDYYKKDGEIGGSAKKALKKHVKIALLGSFTLNGFKEVLNVKCSRSGLGASFHLGGYNRYMQEIADPKSGLFKFAPEVTFLILDARSLFGDLYLDPYGVPARKRIDAANSVFKRLDAFVKRFTKSASGILVVSNIEVPVYSPLGLLETKERSGYFDMVRRVNSLMAGLSKYRNVFVFDYDSFASAVGKGNVRDDKMRYLADMKVAPDVIVRLCDEYMRYIRAVKGLSRKCIVLDLDNTLWGGIVGEDGLEGIKIGPTAPGNAYVEFQKRLLALFNRGVILAVNSSNNREDALRVLNRHPDMVLRERHFAALRINWESKVKNLVEIAKEINIGLDSIIFFEDDKRTRQIVREALPEVLCPDLPDDPSGYAQALEELRELDSLQITREDKKRGTSYASERVRRESAGAFDDLGKYLDHLKITARIAPADKFAIPRIAQLAMRTNQFNFSSKRYSEEDIARLAGDARYGVYSVTISDVYGDYGMTGAVIIRKELAEWRIDTFLLSCRVLGKGVEDAIMAAVLEMAVKEKANRVSAEYLPTEKNAPVFNFLKAAGASLPQRAAKGAAVMLYEKGRALDFSKKGSHVKVSVR